MALVEEKGHAMFLGRNRIVRGGGDDPQAADGQFIAAWSPLILAHRTADLNGALLAQMVGGLEAFRAEVGPRSDALTNAGAVTEQQEMNFATGAAVVQPTLQRHLLAHVAA